MATNPRLSLTLTYLSAILRRPAEVPDDVLANRVAWAMKFAIDAFNTKPAARTSTTLEPDDIKAIQSMIDRLRNGEKL